MRLSDHCRRGGEQILRAGSQGLPEFSGCDGPAALTHSQWLLLPAQGLCDIKPANTLTLRGWSLRAPIMDMVACTRPV